MGLNSQEHLRDHVEDLGGDDWEHHHEVGKIHGVGCEGLTHRIGTMPIEYQIDHARRIVFAKGVGALTRDDLFSYQREVWSCPDVAGYNELADMTEVQTIVQPQAEQVRKLADLSAGMDLPSAPSKFAIVAPQALAFDSAACTKSTGA